MERARGGHRIGGVMSHTSPPGEPGPEKPSFGELLATILGQISTLVRGEIELAQVQLKEKLTKLGIGGALLVVAGVLALYMLGLLLFAAVWAFSLIDPALVDKTATIRSPS